MGSFFVGLVVVLCSIALVVLFFPIRFKLDFDAGENGAKARLFIYKKHLWTGEKKWGKGKDAEAPDSDDFLDAVEPEFVATAPAKPVEKSSAPAAEKKDTPKAESVDKAAAIPTSAATPAPAATPALAANPETSAPATTPAPVETPATTAPPATAAIPVTPAPAAVEKPKMSDSSKPVEEPAPEKKEKRKLTDEEFWTIILTPDLDGRAFRYVKSVLGMIVRLFNIKFKDCFVEGIRSDYATMGYGAAVNGIIKSFPYLESWDIRMDWCHDRDLHAQGELLARTNLCRVLFLLLATLVYAGILLLLFWRRRSRVLKTGELPELGFVRKKIVGWMTEE